MRTILTVAVLVVFSATLTAADTKFESKEGKYSAKFPGEEKPKTISQKAGGLDLYITIVEKGKGGYAVIYSDVTPDVVKAAPAAQLLAGGQKGLEDNFKAKITKSGEAKVLANGKEYPARDILAEKEEMHLRIMLILVDNRLYQVFVVGSKELVSGPDADAFIKSFELAK